MSTITGLIERPALKPCIISAAGGPAPNEMEICLGLVRTAYVATLCHDDFDDTALEGVQLTLAIALKHLEAVSSWVLDAYNHAAQAQWVEAERKGLITLRETGASAREAAQ